METFWILLPIYLLGNLHCLGMCGPLVALLGKQRFCLWYFVGRICSFSFAGLLAGELGEAISEPMQRYHISPWVSFLFGFVILLFVVKSILRFKLPLPLFLQCLMQKVHLLIARLSTKKSRGAIFLFGFLTVLLPCGQSALVFSFCALSQSPLAGLGNGFAFALLTTPSLLFALRTHRLFRFAKSYHHLLMGGGVLFVATLSILRGCADYGWIDHLVLVKSWHLVLY